MNKKAFVFRVLLVDAVLMILLFGFMYSHYGRPLVDNKEYSSRKTFHGTVLGYFYGKHTDHDYVLIWHPATKRGICFQVTDQTILSDEFAEALENYTVGIEITVESAEWAVDDQNQGHDYYPADLIVLSTPNKS